MKVVFVGGWATDKAQYPQLSSSARFLVPFSGFEPDQLAGLIEGGGDVLIGWSTGAHMLLKDCANLFSRFRHVILIAPFLSFTDSFPERVVRRMIAAMDKNPSAVVDSFHENCGESLKLLYDDTLTSALVEGLDYLINSSIESIPVQLPDNLILVHGENDMIVRQTAFELVAERLPHSEVRTLNCGHKISESELFSIIEGL